LVEAHTTRGRLNRHCITEMTSRTNSRYTIILDTIFTSLTRSTILNLLSALLRIIVAIRTSDRQLCTSWAIVALWADLRRISGRDGTEVAEVASLALTCNDSALAVLTLWAE